VEWSPLAPAPAQNGIPAHASEYLGTQASPAQAATEDEARSRKRGMFLPILVLILLVLGLLAALLSSFFLPASSSQGAGMWTRPLVVSARPGVLTAQRGGLSWPS
jgi:hypothetical protein